MPQNSGIVVDPSFLEVVLAKPQATEEVEIAYTNNTKETITLEFFPLDFRQKDEFGTIGFLGEESKSFSYSLSSFLQFETSSLVIAPGEQETLKVLITNRQDMSPGGHYSAIIARQQSRIDEAADTNVSLGLSSLILLRKEGGERFNLSLKQLEWPENFITFSHPKTLTLTFQNEGNVHLVPYGRVEIRDVVGRLTHKGVINTSSFRVFPESRRQIEIEVKPVSWSLPASFETISVVGNDSLEKVRFEAQQSYIYINPIGLILLFLTAFLLWWGFKKRRRNKKAKK